MTSNTVLIVMGVSGSGKSTIAKMLAQQLQLHFIEADDHHSVKAKQMMNQGIALTDDIRKPWVNSICNFTQELLAQDISSVIAYSGLKSAHRKIFRQLNATVKFIYLKLPHEVIEQRLAKRKQHFFSPALLSDQFMQMQEPLNEPGIIIIDAQHSPHHVMKQIMSGL